MRKSIIALTVCLPLLAHAAPEDIFGIPSKTYCLKDVCIGDALSEHEAKLDFKPGKQDFPDCKNSSFNVGTKKAADGSRFGMTLKAVPALAGSDYSAYYRVSSITYFFGKDVPQASQEELAETLGKRMNLTHKRSYVYKTERGATLKNGAEIKIDVDSKNASLMAYQNTARQAEINAQPGCTGKAPNL